MAGLRLLGGSSRFAQEQTTSCGSLKSQSCWLLVGLRLLGSFHALRGGGNY
ncbi:MAG: hypothetical protein IKX48_02100 [Victivallales bacterium]|nr:hypothetical protein [Victivallales bacterium]